IVQAAFVPGLQITAGSIVPSAGSLAAAHLTGVAVGVLVMMRWLPPRLIQGGFASVLAFWSRYRKFPIFSLPADTVNTTAMHLPVALIAAQFGAESAGFVALAFRTLGAPTALLGTAVLDVFKRRASTAW